MKQPTLTPITNSNLYKLVYTFTYDGHTIPQGFTFDGASIPHIAHIITSTPYHPAVITAALVHDHVYKTGKYREQTISRYRADTLFYEIAIKCGCSKYRARRMLLGLLTAGWLAWRKYRNEETC